MHCTDEAYKPLQEHYRALCLYCQWVIKVQHAIGVMALIAPLNTIHCN